jgi:UDP-glucuronate 4-epimerase
LAKNGIDTKSIRYNEIVKGNTNYSFVQLDLLDAPNINTLMMSRQFDVVVNLAAQAGVRYSISHPQVYVNSNIVGFSNILEASRNNNVKHIVYASSSSVYGLNKEVPFTTSQNVDHPISMYAASKKSNELMAHTYSHLFNISTTGLRFFTVYGPWGRPDMAFFLFTKSIIAGQPIQVFNHGNMVRDFTYVDDIVEGLIRVIDNPIIPHKNPVGSSSLAAPYKLYNIGNNAAVKLLDFIRAIEDELGIEAKKEFLPLQPGDVEATFADVSDLTADLNYKPNTSVKDGIKQFVNWYKSYYNIK